jgi:chemotaxis signal transduction protein
VSTTADATNPSTSANNLAVPPAAQFLSLWITPNQEMLLPTEQMSEILSLRLEDVLPIPETTSLVVGVFNWRQQVIWLVDLPAALGRLPLAQQNPGLLQRDVVVVNHAGKTFGLGIARIGKIYRTPDLGIGSETGRPDLTSSILDLGTIIKSLE